MEGVDKLPSSFLFTVAVVIIGTLRIPFSGYSIHTDWGRQELCFGKVHSRMFAETSSLTIKLSK